MSKGGRGRGQDPRGARPKSKRETHQSIIQALENTDSQSTWSLEDDNLTIEKELKTTPDRSARSRSSMPIDKPDDVTEGYWKILCSLHEDIVLNSRTMTNINNKVTAVQQENKELRLKVTVLEKRLDLVDAKQARQDQTTRRHHSQINDLTSRSMKQNIIFTFDKDTDYGKIAIAGGDNCETTVKTFMKNIMGITSANKFHITVAHRLAQDANGNRSIIAQFPYASEHHAVLKNAARLKDTRHYIKQQITAYDRERQQFAMGEYKDLKKVATNKVKLQQGKLVLNGKVQTQYLPDVLPLPALVDEEECGDDPEEDVYPIVRGDHVTDGGSTFTGYAADITGIQDLSNVIDRLLLQDGVAEATHRMYAYRFDGGGTNPIENFDADGDDGIGFELLKAMRLEDAINVVWIVTRHCSKKHKHIGRKRFSHAANMAKSAHDILFQD